MSTDNPNENPTPTDAPDIPGLGDAGKRAIAAERAARFEAEEELKQIKGYKDLQAAKRERDAALQKLAELETAESARAAAELTELERLKLERDELLQSKSTSELEALRLKVAIERGLPANLAARLQGSDYDSLIADADSLVELVDAKQSPFPKADPSQGPKGAGGQATTADMFADFASNKL